MLENVRATRGGPTLLTMLRSARRHLGDLVALRGPSAGFTVALMVVAGLAEGLTIAFLPALLAAAGVPIEGSAVGRIERSAFDSLEAVGAGTGLGSVVLGFVSAGVLAAGLRMAREVASSSVVASYAAERRVRAFAAVGKARWEALAARPAADLTHALTTESARLEYATFLLLSTAAATAVAAAYAGFAVAVSPLGAVLALALAGLAATSTLPLFRRASTLGRELSDLTGAFQRFLAAHLSGLKLVVVSGATEAQVRRFAGFSEELRALHVRATRVYALSTWLREALVLAALGLIAYASLRWLDLAAGDLALLLFAVFRLAPRVSGIAHMLQEYAGSAPAVDTVLALTAWGEAEQSSRAHEGREYVARERASRAHEGREYVAGERTSRAHEGREYVTVDSVSFAYPGRAVPALHNVSFEVPAGAFIAIVGPSGSGKTTAVDVVTGLLAPANGCVTVGGEVLEGSRRTAWAQSLGYVPQEPVLFGTTVRESLLWAAPTAGEDEIRAALAAADVLAAMEALPGGLDSPVGDGGALLSGGERQRVALARALVRRPALLVLDEATSSLDGESERRVLAAVRALRGVMSVLWVSHRLYTAREADRIYVLDGGRVVESGTWQELAGLPGGWLATMASNSEREAGESRSLGDRRP